MHEATYNNDPDGSIQCKERICSCLECLQGHLAACKIEKGKLYNNITCDDIDAEDEENCNEDEDEHEDELPRGTYFDMIQAGAFIAIYSYENSLEPFYICKVIKSDTATENLFEGVGHYVENGNKYLLCNYLEKLKTFEDDCTIN